jgi:predicted CxxxxCH...CXXCH cytochrome family protein
MRSTFCLKISLLVAAASLAACGDPRAATGESAGVLTRCTPCHGDRNRPAGLNPLLPAAPPLGTKGETATTTRAVGAHQRHDYVLCNECHVVPNSMGHSNGTVDMAWGPVATAGGVSPVWNGSSCSASYCHGNFAKGNPGNAPVWTAPRASDCGTCHGLPPTAGGHPASSDCSLCHPGYTSSSVNPAVHVNGQPDIGGLACTSCHGDGTRTGVAGADPNVKVAPPITFTGRSAGAHLAHVNKAGGIMTPAQCAECHAGAVPSSLTGHPSGIITVAFGGRGGSSGSYSQTTLTCSSTYCHGNFPGGNGAAPLWTGAGPLACSACHPSAPSTGQHSRSNHVSAGCGACHPGYTSSTVNVTLHVNGAKSWGNKITSFNGTTCTNTCHDPESWR